MGTKIKICCISSQQEAQIALDSGADVLGLVAKMPSGPGTIADDLIQEIATIIPPHIDSFLLTPKTDPYEIIAHQRATGTNCIQLVDAVPVEAYRVLRANLPNIKLIQVIHVTSEESIIEASMYESLADIILLDSGNPNLVVKELGGTGRKHDWDISKRIVETVSIPVFLAGGLNPENIREAIAFVKPYGVDICSGVRTDGKLDPKKLGRLIQAVNNY
ncbi:phosphoribosylanthranilate isomerase [Arcicella aquatica]|uniref:N-(5'-phosphoribosyl)anthranilate isomerase n=1 Tax=Arcicella aquatica TaxID=217141 RepID=A0ABU5QPK0_9BACT|nr:phosphoribosylanthranilate isomerase [Arcicella aquatica]MEA5259017.1 phosphoribosylanthranilate isomerase [Arcicella aquatica]